MKKAFLISARVLLIAAIICTLLFAFYQSSLPPTKSNDMSDSASEVLEMIIPSDTYIGEQIHNNIRAFAHFSEFFVLGFFVALFCSLVSTNNIKITKSKRLFVYVSLAFGTLCAFVDETIQIFSSRSFEISDILIDSLGYLIALLSVYYVYFGIFFVLNLISRHKNKHKD